MDAVSSMVAGVMGAVAPVVSAGFIAEGKVSGSADSDPRSPAQSERRRALVEKRRPRAVTKGQPSYEHEPNTYTDSYEHRERGGWRNPTRWLRFWGMSRYEHDIWGITGFSWNGSASGAWAYMHVISITANSSSRAGGITISQLAHQRLATGCVPRQVSRLCKI
ncbi:hypothetical protein F5Y14DRAFT_453758 [Nemania sp. NC0429]|nr:hypothetical protein F5Y14DRAFT_453758 [Nemania sp. NC0429]